MGNTPILILKEGTKRDRGKDAQYNNIMAARAIADAVRSTLGPRGMDKMLVDSLGDVVITNDGVTILKEIDVDHPAAKMVVEVAKTQDEEAGDGTTTAVILSGELLKKAIDLIDSNIHPTIIAGGYRLAATKAQAVLDDLAMNVDVKDKKTLKLIAETSMISKSVSGSRENLADLSVKAVSAVAEQNGKKWNVDLDNIQIVKKTGGSMDDTEFIQGIIIDKEPVHTGMPKRVEKAKIALLDVAVEVQKTEIDAKIEITDPSQMQAFLAEEENMLRKMVANIKKAGANAVFCQKGIDDLAQHFLAKEKIFAVRRVKKSDMEKLAKATGATVVTKIEELSAEELGSAALIEVRQMGDDGLSFVTGCKNPKAVSLLLRGGTEHVIDEVERSLDDAMSVVAVAIEDGKIVTGGGSTAVEIAMKLREYAASVGGREQIAIDAYASALEVVPTALAENAGLDPIDILINMRKAHKDGKTHAGLNVYTGKVVDMMDQKVIEPIRVSRQALNSATDAAVLILRIDDVIAARGMGPGAGAPGGAPDMGGDED
ncbi:MAG: TCP-1/cpn60 chaperonin family protein [Methanomassiliicoccus sp.]|nr:TCP-1/cpn60 chaperonin family protein [Methanomassiliicoccus sp.]